MTKWSELQSPSVPVEKSSWRSTAGKGEGRLPVFSWRRWSRISIVSGSIRTSARVASLSTSSAVTSPQSEESRIRSCAIAGPINPNVTREALNDRFSTREPPPDARPLASLQSGTRACLRHLHRVAAVDDQRVPDDERGRVRTQPEHRRRDLLGLAHASDRLLGDDPRHALGRPAGEPL